MNSGSFRHDPKSKSLRIVDFNHYVKDDFKNIYSYHKLLYTHPTSIISDNSTVYEPSRDLLIEHLEPTKDFRKLLLIPVQFGFKERIIEAVKKQTLESFLESELEQYPNQIAKKDIFLKQEKLYSFYNAMFRTFLDASEPQEQDLENVIKASKQGFSGLVGWMFHKDSINLRCLFSRDCYEYFILHEKLRELSKKI